MKSEIEDIQEHLSKKCKCGRDQMVSWYVVCKGCGNAEERCQCSAVEE